MDSITLLFNNIRLQVPVLPETSLLGIVGIGAIVAAALLIIKDSYRWIVTEVRGYQKASSSSENLTKSIKQVTSQETEIPPPFETAACTNCGSKWPVPPLTSLQKSVLSMTDPGYNEDMPRTVICPKCKLPAIVTPQPKWKQTETDAETNKDIGAAIGELVKREDAREKEKKLSVHYDNLVKIFRSWNAMSPIRTTTIADGCVKSQTAIYLNGWVAIEEDGNVSIKRCLEHIKIGYRDLQVFFDNLKTLEYQHNRTASDLLEKVHREVMDNLNTFPELMPYKVPNMTNFHHPDKIELVIQEGCTMTISPTVTYTSDRDFSKAMDVLKATEDQSSLKSLETGEIARGNETTLTRLKAEIERLREIHASEFQGLKNNHDKDKQLILAIKKETEKILYDIDDHNLKGECDYELSLDSKLTSDPLAS